MIKVKNGTPTVRRRWISFVLLGKSNRLYIYCVVKENETQTS